jgi:hypothetical protein
MQICSRSSTRSALTIRIHWRKKYTETKRILICKGDERKRLSLYNNNNIRNNINIFRLAAHNNVAKNTASTRPEQSAIIIGKKPAWSNAITIHYMSGFFGGFCNNLVRSVFIFMFNLYFANIESSSVYSTI